MDFLNENVDPTLAAYEAMMCEIDRRAEQPDGVLGAVCDFAVLFLENEKNALGTVASLTDMMVKFLHDDTNQDMGTMRDVILRGAMAGLYVSNELYGNTLSSAGVIASVRLHCHEGDDGRVDARQPIAISESMLATMSPQTKEILARWRTACGATNLYEKPFDIAFGLIVGSANKTIDLMQMEIEETNWDDFPFEEEER